MRTLGFTILCLVTACFPLVLISWKTEIKNEPEDIPGSLNALEPITGNELASGDAPIVKNAEIKTEYDADEVPAKIPKVTDSKMKPGPSKMTT